MSELSEEEGRLAQQIGFKLIEHGDDLDALCKDLGFTLVRVPYFLEARDAAGHGHEILLPDSLHGNGAKFYLGKVLYYKLIQQKSN